MKNILTEILNQKKPSLSQDSNPARLSILILKSFHSHLGMIKAQSKSTDSEIFSIFALAKLWLDYFSST